MEFLSNYVREYTAQLRKGHIQQAYKGIISFMSGLSGYLAGSHTEYTKSALYFGYMDMTYFAFTPAALKDKKLKIAIVYLHEEARFEAWLGGINRKIQAEYIELLRRKDIGEYTLSELSPGVDSIIEATLVDQPDFDQLEELKMQIEKKVIEFAYDMLSFLS